MNQARNALLLHKKEQSALIQALMKKHRVNATDLAELIQISGPSIQKAASSARCDQVSLDLIYQIHYHLFFKTWDIV